MKRIHWLKVAAWAWVACWALLAVIDLLGSGFVGMLKDMALGAFLTALVAGVTAAYVAITRNDDEPPAVEPITVIPASSFQQQPFDFSRYTQMAKAAQKRYGA